jgi:acyl transferase domain-containing protein
MISNLADYIQARRKSNGDVNLDDLAHTLGTRRSLFQWRTAVTAADSDELLQSLEDSSLKPQHARGEPRIGFVFNGQGAQWHAMGRELFAIYPVFRQSMEKAEQVLKSYGVSWSLVGECRMKLDGLNTDIFLRGAIQR